ncbi:hypothetical protein PIB30_042107 [Stylosanthes scabra]|uniref:Uncharacterized protein n=1 Tax=Stylosanthes scabra TaxID=79078 RepID=A0ABU6UEE4_9FABA|nr:hypothetical protein [Stylosanthes scabra]
MAAALPYEKSAREYNFFHYRTVNIHYILNHAPLRILLTHVSYLTSFSFHSDAIISIVSDLHPMTRWTTNRLLCRPKELPNGGEEHKPAPLTQIDSSLPLSLPRATIKMKDKLQSAPSSLSVPPSTRLRYVGFRLVSSSPPYALFH